MNVKYSRHIFEKYSYQISWKSGPREPSCYMRADGRKNRYTEANSRYSNAPKHTYSDYIMFHPQHFMFMQGLSSLTGCAAATTRFYSVTRLRSSYATPHRCRPAD
jgi:hypothetical protein